MMVAPGFFLSLTLAGIEGIIAYAYYDTLGCDPLASKQITNPNQVDVFNSYFNTSILENDECVLGISQFSYNVNQ